ncbi:hypothetical protein BLGI_2917 [Brevibacillus laterosporus GI-9]|nr:hypothetical protein BLGI_2917 [Brevibacillus laterosporus GI-9]
MVSMSKKPLFMRKIDRAILHSTNHVSICFFFFLKRALQWNRLRIMNFQAFHTA